MILDEIFGAELNQYLLDATSAESPLLQQLRKETSETTQFGKMQTGPIEGRLLQILVKAINATSCLELGTFTGYSALCIAQGLPNEGKLITCENRKHHAINAQKYFDMSEHGHKIELKLGDATKTVPLLEETFDFIFIDADKINYPFYYDALLPKLKNNGLMVIDNALWGAEVLDPKEKDAIAIHQLNMKVRNDPKVESVILSVRDGILLIRKF